MSAVFSSDYYSARQRFRELASAGVWELHSYPIETCILGGEELTIDVAVSRDGDPRASLVLSSGVHGVEGFVGSAVQLSLMEQAQASAPAGVKRVLIHGVNPYGFAALRRFNEHNVDLNRNFLLAGEAFAGSPEGYASFNTLLNPRHAPSMFDPFMVKASMKIARHGLPFLRQAIAGGQYDHPQGLFYGGDCPSQSQQILRDNFPHWLAGCRDVIHLDFHTGLGRRGDCKLLIDYELTSEQRAQLVGWFGSEAIEACQPQGISYHARGSLGRWCVNQPWAANYSYACVEFGTYPPIQVLAGLRAENQAHHWGNPDDASTRQAKERLKELFCPSAETWRWGVLQKSSELIAKASQGLQQLASE